MADVTHSGSNPPIAKHELERTGSFDDRRRALPKAAAILRNFKGLEDEGLQRTPSNLSLASAIPTANTLLEAINLSQLITKADGNAMLALQDDTSRKQGR